MTVPRQIIKVELHKIRRSFEPKMTEANRASDPHSERARGEAQRMAWRNLSDHFDACGYALANAKHDTRAIQGSLGHRAIQHTARYAS